MKKIAVKKSAVISVLSFIAGALLAFFILIFVFDEKIKLICLQAIYAVFTGCIFAIPSALVVLYHNLMEPSDEEYYDLYKLKEIIQQLKDKLDKDALSPEVIQMYSDQIKPYYKKLNHIATHCYFFGIQHKKNLYTVLSATHDAISDTREVKILLQREMTEIISSTEKAQKNANLRYALTQCLDSANELLGEQRTGQ